MSSLARKVLIAVAAPAEARAVLSAFHADHSASNRQWQRIDLAEDVDLVVTGVGKSNAAGAVARLLDTSRHRSVMSVGVCGSLPRLNGKPGLALRDVILASACAFADEGLQTDDSFRSLADMGFPPTPGLSDSMPVDPVMHARLSRLADASGPIATVSTCSGTDDRARRIVQSTGAAAEAMEGAAIALVAHRLGVGFAELRVVSNTTGSRTRQVWDLAGALARLSDLAPRVRDALQMPPGEAGEG